MCIKYSYTLNLYLILFTSLYGQNIEQCDSIIRLGINASQQKEYSKSTGYLLRAKNIAESQELYNQLFISTNAIGQNYYNLFNYGEALNYFTEAYTIANKQLDADSKVIALTNIAHIYVSENNIAKAKHQYLQALDLATKNNITVAEGELYAALGNVENKLGNLNTARLYILKSIDLLKKEPEKQFAAQIILAENELLAGNASGAGTIARELLESDHDHNNDISLMVVIAKSFFAHKRYDESVNTANKALELNPDIQTKRDIFGILSRSYFAEKSYESAFRYKDSIINANAVIDSLKNGSLLQNGMLAFENRFYKDELDNANLNSAADRKILHIALIIVVLLFSACLIIIRKIKRASGIKHKKLLDETGRVKNDLLLLQKQMREQGDSTIHEQERLNNELDSLKRKLLTQALFTSSRNSLLEEVITSLLQKPALLKDNILTSKITTLQNNLNEETEWETFISVFEDVNQAILQRIKQQHPNLTQNDLRFLAYIYMNLSIKEIASILNITPESCRKRKERIALKMDIQEKSNLYDYILQF